MKIVYIVVFSFMFSTLLQAQDAGTNMASALTTGKYRQLFQKDFSRPSYSGIVSAQSTRSDTVPRDAYGDLRKDDPEYNQKVPLWSVGARVFLNNALTVAVDKYVFDYDFARIGPRTWMHNLKTGWEWDNDRFGMNYFVHPYSGAGYFNAARSNGYNFYESAPFSFGGSLMWEYFGENTLPSINDLINTTFTGVFLGEISYRLSSNFLDDQTTGAERFFRELFAGIINPQRAFSRLLRGRLTRETSEEIYQKEPLTMTFAAGAHLVNDGRSFGTGSTKGMLVLLLRYGSPFEQRSRTIYDFFRLRADLTNGLGRKIVDNIIGEAFLFGKNFHSGNMEMLIGGFQHYDFWDNFTFELATVAFGPGMISKLPVSANSTLYFDVHFGIVPLGANSMILGPNNSEFRDYNYGGGAEGKLEGVLVLGGWAKVRLRSNYYWLHTYVGIAGDNFIGIVRPTVEFRLVDNLSIGFEHLVYYSDRYALGVPTDLNVRTEQKVFLQYDIENFK
jgi:Domain of unknown function (DUF3943)